MGAALAEEAAFAAAVAEEDAELPAAAADAAAGAVVEAEAAGTAVPASSSTTEQSRCSCLLDRSSGEGIWLSTLPPRAPLLSTREAEVTLGLRHAPLLLTFAVDAREREAVGASALAARGSAAAGAAGEDKEEAEAATAATSAPAPFAEAARVGEGDGLNVGTACMVATT